MPINFKDHNIIQDSIQLSINDELGAQIINRVAKEMNSLPRNKRWISPFETFNQKCNKYFTRMLKKPEYVEDEDWFYLLQKMSEQRIFTNIDFISEFNVKFK